MAKAYFMKCGEKVEIKNPKQVTLKNRKPAVQSVCLACGTRVFQIRKA